jgi:hypothetical protein
MRVVADDRRCDAPSVGQRGFDLVRTTDDVAIGQRKPVRGEHEARPTAGARWLRTTSAVGRRGELDVDLDHRGRDLVDRAGDYARIRVEEVVVLGFIDGVGEKLERHCCL